MITKKNLTLFIFACLLMMPTLKANACGGTGLTYYSFVTLDVVRPTATPVKLVTGDILRLWDKDVISNPDSVFKIADGSGSTSYYQLVNPGPLTIIRHYPSGDSSQTFEITPAIVYRGGGCSDHRNDNQ